MKKLEDVGKEAECACLFKTFDTQYCFLKYCIFRHVFPFTNAIIKQ